MKRYFIILGIFLSGCASTSEDAIDPLPQSPCAHCTEKPFYIDGEWSA